MKRHLASLLLSLPLAAGCGDASSTDAPSDAAAVTDVVSLPDAPSLLDAPASIDVPAAIDAGSTSDTPSSAMPEVPPPPPPPPVDVPVAMADVPPPPPPPPPVMACIATAAIGNGGGTCSGIDQAFSARGINAGYYPFRVLRPIVLRTLRSRLGHWVSDRVTGLERVASKATTLSRVMGTDGLDRIDALKVDVEGAELDVLEGISYAHWGCVRQVALEGHDQDGRLDRVKALLSRHGFDRIEVRVSAEHRQRELNNYLLLAQRRDDAGARPKSGAPGT